MTGPGCLLGDHLQGIGNANGNHPAVDEGDSCLVEQWQAEVLCQESNSKTEQRCGHSLDKGQADGTGLRPCDGGNGAILSQLGNVEATSRGQPGGPCPSRMLRKAFTLARLFIHIPLVVTINRPFFCNNLSIGGSNEMV